MVPLKDDNPNDGLPVVNYLLIVANLTVFFYLRALPDNAAEHFMLSHGVVPRQIWHGEHWWNVFTAMFVQNAFHPAHVAFNMLSLAIFGDNIEVAMGHLRYFVFYLLGGLIAGMIHVAAVPACTKAMIGASGAISAVMGAYLVLYPRRTILFFAPLVLLRLPALIYMVLWLGWQIVHGLTNAGAGGVAWYAHLGGFLAGAGLVWPLCLSRRRAERRLGEEHSSSE
ncbi:MAG: rhomboid family intramembrane serine protease [candidate division KSB1 bacterium]|nr:rhomboid family intramembrane serine protease [candidate division KSB1 bacterium]MDZ7275954.1 rhomboid family intramembrane serine protease [candidate division KSB1 bacterium]MDZ7285764.1 rhomboid family intramembrane serine protease [candidate division KSB1 bacterium]MDZ7298796.1 rhomboid family intramembrane serine protease [candidate division KSB1 bacterium]MDZ7307914.1 rhomboid family intramembrane serine protease [candidate division KSB1 bacterium]